VYCAIPLSRGELQKNEKPRTGKRQFWLRYRARSGRITSKPDVIGWFVGFLPKNDRSLSKLPRAPNLHTPHTPAVGAVPIGIYRFSGLIRFATRKLALSERVGAAPDPSATLDLSEYHSLNCETVRPSHCSHGESKRRGTYSTLKCRQPSLSCCECLGDVRFHH
jgi:hypothetical protein